jgi:rod shape-determining protein MreB
VAGDRFNADIISYIRNEFKILVGEKTAEEIKLDIGSVVSLAEPREKAVRGRDLITGLPREVMVTDADVREAISAAVDLLVEAAKEVLETTPPEILSDVMHRGVHIFGGGALLRGLDVLMAETLKIPVHIAPDPLTAVARGTGIVLENIPHYHEALIDHEDEILAQ